MKKLLALMLCLVLVYSCNDDDSENAVSCVQATQNVVTALTNFNDAQTNYEDFCNAYKLALQKQKESCGDSSGAIQTVIDGLEDCIEE